MRILPLGDSITLGMHANAVPTDPTLGGWRAPVFAVRPQIDFVGGLSNGPAALLTPQHDGYAGYAIGPLASVAGQDISENIAAWLSTANPDLVMLMAGTVDLAYNLDIANAPARLAALIDQIFSLKPGVIVLLSTIPPTTVYNNALFTAFNAALPAIVEARRLAGKQIQLINAGGVLTAADLSDGVHPNAAGYQKMANAWLCALNAYISPADDLAFSVQVAASPNYQDSGLDLGPAAVREVLIANNDGVATIAAISTGADSNPGNQTPHGTVTVKAQSQERIDFPDGLPLGASTRLWLYNSWSANVVFNVVAR